MPQILGRVSIVKHLDQLDTADEAAAVAAHLRISWQRPIFACEDCITSTCCLMALFAMSFSSTPPTNTCTYTHKQVTLRVYSA